MARPHLLFAWELGENFGHIAKMLGVIRALGDRAEVTVAVRDPAALRRMAPGLPLRLLPAPVAPTLRPPDADGPGASYPDVLRWCGWHAPEPLAALLESWRALFALLRPDVVIGQAAPTALLAARGGPWRTALLGSGYDAPPRAAPMPPLRWWMDGEAARAADREARVLADANAALARLSLPPLARFADALSVDRFWLACWREIDHYGDRARWEPDHPPYLGQIAETAAGAALDWRDGDRRRLFAYLRHGRTGFAQAAAMFATPAPDWDVIVAAPGAPPAATAPMAAAGARVVDGPVRLDRLLPRCDLGLHHASNGVTAALLAAGAPQIGLPGQTEQLMCARALGDAGLGLALAGRYDAAALRGVVDRALAAPRLKAACRAAAARLAAAPDPRPRIAAEALALADGG